jgi:hypothetical protein
MPTSGILNRRVPMDRPVKLGELILAIIATIITLGGMVYSRGTIDTADKDHVQFLQTQFDEFKAQQAATNTLLFQKLDKVNDNLGDLKVILQNKQDRK